MDDVERVARAMCSADGYDADERSPAGVDPDFQLGADFWIGDYAPRWRRYEKLARRFLAGLRALV